MAAPVITIYKNGDTYYHGKRLVLNRKEIRNFDAFLDRVTKDISSKVAVRSIRTPSHGHRVANLDKLENGGIYVAVGPERFKKLEYKEVSNLPAHRPQKPPEQIIKPVVHSRVLVSGRARKVAAAETLANKTIFVFRNGDDKHPSFKILLDKRILHTNMDTILQFITEKVNLRTGAVKRATFRESILPDDGRRISPETLPCKISTACHDKCLYTLDGLEILDSSQVKTMEKYVAVGFGKKFLRMAYNENSNSSTPRRGGPKVKSTSSEPPFRKRKQKPPVKAMSQGHVKELPKNDHNFEDYKKSAEIPSEEDHTDRSDEDNSLVRGITQDLSPQPASRISTEHEKEASGKRDEEPAMEASLPKEAPVKKSYRKEAKVKAVSERKKSEAIAKRKQSKAKKSESSDAGSFSEDILMRRYDGEEEVVDNGKESTIFKATGDQAESAKPVNDNQETNVEKPVDMMPATEVEEELETEELENEVQENENKTDSVKADKPIKSSSPEARDSAEKEADPAANADEARSEKSKSVASVKS